MVVQVCPNKSSKTWKEIVDKYGEDLAYAAYIRNGEVIPPLSYVDNMLVSQNNINLQEKAHQEVDPFQLEVNQELFVILEQADLELDQAIE